MQKFPVVRANLLCTGSLVHYQLTILPLRPSELDHVALVQNHVVLLFLTKHTLSVVVILTEIRFAHTIVTNANSFVERTKINDTSRQSVAH